MVDRMSRAENGERPIWGSAQKNCLSIGSSCREQDLMVLLCNLVISRNSLRFPIWWLKVWSLGGRWPVALINMSPKYNQEAFDVTGPGLIVQPYRGSPRITAGSPYVFDVNKRKLPRLDTVTFAWVLVCLPSTKRWISCITSITDAW